jgi:hypothetical protein
MCINGKPIFILYIVGITAISIVQVYLSSTSENMHVERQHVQFTTFIISKTKIKIKDLIVRKKKKK